MTIMFPSLLVEGAPVQTVLPHVVRELRLGPKRNEAAEAESDHERPVPGVSNLVHHEGHTGHLTPGLGSRGPCGRGGDARVLPACRPDLLRFGHAALEVGIDFGDFFLGYHDFVVLVANNGISEVK
jgi:hypothetical protein